MKERDRNWYKNKKVLEQSKMIKISRLVKEETISICR